MGGPQPEIEGTGKKNFPRINNSWLLVGLGRLVRPLGRGSHDGRFCKQWFHNLAAVTGTAASPGRGARQGIPQSLLSWSRLKLSNRGDQGMWAAVFREGMLTQPSGVRWCRKAAEGARA
jgi:hypothetical protein